MSLCEVKRGTTVFKPGSIGNFFYIIKKGEIKLLINNISVKLFSERGSFGELALLHESPRSGTVIALSDCLFYVLERKDFRRILNGINESNFDENKKFLDSVQLLTNIDNDQKMILVQNLVQEIWSKGKEIIKGR